MTQVVAGEGKYVCLVVGTESAMGKIKDMIFEKDESKLKGYLPRDSVGVET